MIDGGDGFGNCFVIKKLWNGRALGLMMRRVPFSEMKAYGRTLWITMKNILL